MKKMIKKMIIRNSVRCRKCGDVIKSIHRHDRVVCGCKAVGISGGREYLRFVGEIKDIENLCIVKEVDTENMNETKILSNKRIAELINSEGENVCIKK